MNAGVVDAPVVSVRELTKHYGTLHAVDGRGAAIVLGIDVARRPGELKERIGVQLQSDSRDRGGLYRVVPRTVSGWRDMPTAARWRFQRR